MKRTLKMLAVSAVLALSGAYGQTSKKLVANIPFEFRVGNTLLPAGEYVTQDLASDLIAIRDDNFKPKAMVLTHACQTIKVPAEGKLIFHRYGDSYFLSRIWRAGDPIGKELQPTAAEREMAKAVHRPTELASVRADLR